MQDKAEILRSELEDLADEIVTARRDLRRLTSRRRLSRGRALLAAVFLVVAAGWWSISAQGNSEPYVVKAPFTVVDKSGKIIFRVEDGHTIYVANSSGTPVAGMANYGGGAIYARADNKPGVIASMNANVGSLGVSLSHETQMAFIGEEWFFRGKGKGDAKTNHGLAAVFSSRGLKAVAALTFTEHRGVAAVYHTSGKAIAMLTESDKITGAGRLKISTSSVDGVFSAGATENGGDACAKRGKALSCLQPGLPLSIQY